MPLTCTFFQFNAYFTQFNASSSTSLHPCHKANTEIVTCSLQHKSVSPTLLKELAALKGESEQWSAGADGSLCQAVDGAGLKFCGNPAALEHLLTHCSGAAC